MKSLVFLLLSAFTVNGQYLRYWYINDINYDPTYNSTGESCVKKVTDRNPKGQYECDPPWSMVEGAIRQMAYTNSAPEFIVWGGANGFHVNSSQTTLTEDLMLEIIVNITDIFKTEFPGIQVVPVLGNHDWWPKSQLPADGDTTNNDLYDKYYELWKDWIPAEYEQTFKKAGYYKISLSQDRLTAIVINSDLYLPENNAVTGSDPGGQFAWLEEQLKAARVDKVKIHIMGHAPLGSLKENYNTRLADIIREYSDVIVAIYGGYHMTDQFRLVYDNDGKAVAYVLVAPSLSPRIGEDSSARNAAYRQYHLDIDGGIIDSQQYHLNLGQDKDWETLYQYSHYGMFRVNATNLDKLYKKMETYANEEFHSYHKYKHVDIGLPYFEPCGCDCKYSELCAIRHIDREPYKECIELAAQTCGASKKYHSILLMFALFAVSKVIHL